ncbi:MAG: hypothetical protein ACFFB3_10795 [Candidatus Hodarchaeota archaeon]
MRRIPLQIGFILALVVIVNVPAIFIVSDNSNATPTAEDLNVYQLADTTTWNVNKTMNFTVYIINSLHDEPFYNVTFNHEFRDEFIIEESTNSTAVYNGTWEHNVTYFWDSIQPNETLTFWTALRVIKTGSTTIARFRIHYNLEDGTPKVTVSSNNWDIDVIEAEETETETEDDDAPGPAEGEIDYGAAIVILGFILPIVGFALTYSSIYFLRIKRHKSSA